MTDKEVLQQALDAIRNSTPTPLATDCEYAEGSWQLRKKAIAGLEAIIAQPVASPRRLYEASRDAAVNTLMGLGYEYFGASQWQPPVQPRERDALQADTARIDWLTASTESHGFHHTGNGDYRHYAHQVEGYSNVRETIDKAMKETK